MFAEGLQGLSLFWRILKHIVELVEVLLVYLLHGKHSLRVVEGLSVSSSAEKAWPYCMELLVHLLFVVDLD